MINQNEKENGLLHQNLGENNYNRTMLKDHIMFVKHYCISVEKELQCLRV